MRAWRHFLLGVALLHSRVTANGFGAACRLQPLQWQFASSGSSTYTWSYKTAREQGLPDAPSQPNGAVCNFYKDNPYTEGQFKLALQESGNAPVVTHTLAAVDAGVGRERKMPPVLAISYEWGGAHRIIRGSLRNTATSALPRRPVDPMHG